MCIREGKDQVCGCLCSAKLELKFFFPEYDQKKKKKVMEMGNVVVWAEEWITAWGVVYGRMQSNTA